VEARSCWSAGEFASEVVPSVILSEAKDLMPMANGVLAAQPWGPSLRSGRQRRPLPGEVLLL